jgi:GNAT superfamily N-acetyltransferase
MRIRFAEVADLTAITQLINHAFFIERSFTVGDRISFAAVRKLFGKGRFLLVEENADILGCVYAELRGDRAYLGLLAVKPAHQRSGIGSRLMAAAEEFARDSGCRSIDLRVVNLRQELPGVYRMFGYEATRIEAPETELVRHFTQPAHFIVMSKQLGPVPSTDRPESHRPQRAGFLSRRRFPRVINSET